MSVRRADGARACSVNGARIATGTWTELEQGDVVSFGGAAEVGKNEQLVPNPFLYVVAQHPPVHAQNSVGTAIDLTSPDPHEAHGNDRNHNVRQV